MKISFVIPCYCSEKTIDKVVDEIKVTMTGFETYEYEVILVNDSSPDNTYEVIKRISQEYNNVTAINLAKNFGQHSAIMAGFGFVTGDIIICMDDDGQTPATEIGKFFDKIDEGYDVVYAKYNEKKHSKFRNFGSKVNKTMTEIMLGKPKELYVSSFFACRRYIVDEIVKYQGSYPYVIGLVLRTTKRICNVDIQHRDRLEGVSGYSFKKLIALWTNGFTAFSVKPLRIATISGVILAVVGFIYALYTIINKFVNPEVLLGWSSTISVILIIGGMILTVLGIIGEYIGRIYICINNSPQYVIRDVSKKEET